MREIKEKKGLEDSGRRKAVKTIVGGVTAVAAYSLLPQTWDKPIIESVFLPAHAATSGMSISDPCSVSITKGDQSTTVHFRIDGYVVPATSGLPVDLAITTIGGPDAGTGTFPSSMTGLVTDENGEFSQEFGNWAAGTQRIEVTTTVVGADGSANCAADVPQQAQQPSTPAEEPADEEPVAQPTVPVTFTWTSGDDDVTIIYFDAFATQTTITKSSNTTIDVIATGTYSIENNHSKAHFIVDLVNTSLNQELSPGEAINDIHPSDDDTVEIGAT